MSRSSFSQRLGGGGDDDEPDPTPAPAAASTGGPLASTLPAWINTALVLLFLATVFVVLLVTRRSMQAQVLTALRDAKIDPVGLMAVPWFALAGALCGLLAVRRVLWNLTSRYEFWPDRVRIIHGGFLRVEREYPWTEFHDARFSQHPLQMPFRSGTLILESASGEPLRLEECPEAEHWAREIRPQIQASRPKFNPGRTSRAGAASAVAASAAPAPTASAQPQVVVVKEKRSGCMTCLILLVILILVPPVLGLIFNVAAVSMILNTLRQLFGH